MCSTFESIQKIIFIKETNLEQICPRFGVSKRGVFVVDRPIARVLHGSPAESFSVVLGQTPLGLGVSQLYDPQTCVPQH